MPRSSARPPSLSQAQRAGQHHDHGAGRHAQRHRKWRHLQHQRRQLPQRRHDAGRCLGDTLAQNAPIVSDANSGTIDISANGTFDVGGSPSQVASIAANQTVDFTAATGVLQLHQPTSFAADIQGFATGDTIDLAGITANQALWANDTLTIRNSGTTVTTLSLTGDYSSSVARRDRRRAPAAPL